MIQLAYVSSTRGILAFDELANILVVSRDKNARFGITGILLYKDGNVLQVIEGGRTEVLNLFELIRKDPRHGGVIKLYVKEVAGRDFPDWSMAFQELDAMSAGRLEGYNEFLEPDFDMHSIKATAAAKLISCFKKGLSEVK